MCESQSSVLATGHGGNREQELDIHLLGPAALASPYHAYIDLSHVQVLKFQKTLTNWVR